ncbi:diguanylate cyclase domain-containing protein [Lacimicrobium alkaliphilum]|uniref:diguanylate cyclase domain-containing protein n=1 Tax=Lacimicrobium alkaliphilum TaxID=1526571 RepID=UPI001E54957A|nr:diguanylate cyclase [Lacimicrobium alkaliphilum]
MASASLTITIVLAGFCIMFFTPELASARYGLLLFFTLPIILRICYGNKAAVAGMLLNVIPFAVLLINEPLAPLLGIDMSLPGTYIYLSSLVFLFFNFCLPVAVIRVLTSLEQQSQLNREQSKKLGKLVKRYQEIFNNGGTPSFFCDQQGRILHANKSARKLMHNAPADCRFIYELFTLTRPLIAGETAEAALHSDSNAIYKIQPASLIHHKKQLIHCFDISHTTAADKKIGQLKRQHITKHYSDALTELKNHHYWSHQFPQTLAHPHTVILLKLANLKDINLQYSFSAGDQVLADAAALLRNQLPSSVNLYRFPGAKFLLSVNTSQSSTENIPDWLEKHLPVQVIQRTGKKELMFNLQWRAGYCSSSGFTSAPLLAEACAIALSQTTPNRPCEQYDSKVVKLIRQDTRNKDRVKRLLDEGSLALWLQPQVDQHHKITGFEVLARLDDPAENQILQPYQFLPQIEKNK